MKKIIIIVVLLVVLVGAAAGLYFMGYIGGGTEGEDEHGEVASEDSGHGESTSSGDVPLYLALEPPFVVNFTHRGTLRYLQVSLEVMYQDQAILDKVTATMPAIRNELILLFSEQEYMTLSTLEGKQELRQEINQAINKVLEIKASADDTGAVYITNFIMQ